MEGHGGKGKQERANQAEEKDNNIFLKRVLRGIKAEGAPLVGGIKRRGDGS